MTPPSACPLAASSTVRAQRRRRIVGHSVPGYGEGHTTERYQLILGRCRDLGSEESTTEEIGCGGNEDVKMDAWSHQAGQNIMT